MAKDKKSFLIYCDLIHSVEHLTDEEKGRLFQHLLEYVNDMSPVLTDRMLLGSWKPIELQLKRDLVKYESIRERNSKNGSKGGRPKEPKEPNGLIGNPSEPKKADTVTDTVTDNDTVKDIKEKKGVLILKEFPLGFDSLIAEWELWKSYKKKNHKFTYSSELSEARSIRTLLKLSKGDENTSVLIIQASIDNGWKGFFELKQTNNKNNETNKSTSRLDRFLNN